MPEARGREPVARSHGDVVGRKGRATRERLVAEVEKRCLVQHHRHITVGQVAAAAGTSAATFYTYFPDVPSVVAEVATRHLTGFGPVIERAVDVVRAEGSLDACRSFVAAYFEFWAPRPGLLEAIIVAAPDEDPRFFRVLLRAIVSVTYALMPAVRQGDPLSTAAPLVNMVSHSAARREAFRHDSIDEERLVESLAWILHRVLAADPVA